MTTTAFDIEAKLTQNFQPSSTKQIKYETKSLSNGTKAISRNAWTEVNILLFYSYFLISYFLIFLFFLYKLECII